MKIRIHQQENKKRNLLQMHKKPLQKKETKEQDTMSLLPGFFPPALSFDAPPIQGKGFDRANFVGGQASKISQPAQLKSSLFFNPTPKTPIQKKEVEVVNYNNIAKDVHDAIDGLGTDEEKVYHALAKLRRNPIAIKTLKEVYKSTYKVDLMTDIKGDF